MAIIRSPRPHNFTTVDNRLIRDTRLSYKARGILIDILSNVDNWRITADDLAKRSPDGRSAILSGLEELRNAGYILTTRKQGADGRWMTESFVYDRPQSLPKFDYPTSVFPTSDNPTSLERPSKKDHKEAEAAASARNQSPVQKLTLAYLENLPDWAVKPSFAQICGQMGAYLKNNDFDDLLYAVSECAKEGKPLSVYDLQRIQRARQIPKPADAPTPTPPRFIPEQRADAVPMPANFRDLLQSAMKKGVDGD